ncbi:MAG: 7-carboxy-7-deazaguanine synthase QueE [Planctomycetota bacterium]
MTSDETGTATARLSEVFPTVQGEGAYVGRRQLFVRLAGCSIGCRFCDTPESLRPGSACRIRTPGQDGKLASREVRNPVSCGDLLRLISDLARRHGPFHALSVTGGEPLEQVEFLLDLLPGVELPVLLETAGTLPEALRRLISRVDIVSMDLKLPSVAGAGDFLARHEEFLRVALQKDVYVKTVVNERLEREEWRQAAAMVAGIAPEIPFFVQPETRRRGKKPIAFEFLTVLADEAFACGLKDVRIQPQLHTLLGAP